MAFRNVLIVDDEESIRHVLVVLLQDRGFSVRAVSSAIEALRELEARPYDVVVTDVRMKEMTGIELVRRAADVAPDTSFLVMSAYGSQELAIEAVQAGAADWLSKPFKPDELILRLRLVEERDRYQREVRRLRAELAAQKGLDALVGESPSMADLGKQIRKVAPVKSTVLITGESGTGKELVARALHELSPRSAMPFVPVNCGAIPEQLIESELFGHVKGAFTDASRNRKGLFAEADGGTIFLDEVAELPLGMQVKLLRVLQEEEIRPVGDARSQKVDVRVLSATMRDLHQDVAAGRFREDLYYRLNVVGLHLPALRERTDDVPRLVKHFVGKYNARLRRDPPISEVAPDALAALVAFHWPGNVRELENTIERALVLADGPTLGLEALPERLRRGQLPDRRAALGLPDGDGADLSIKKASRSMEETLIRRALERTGGNRTRAAEILELSHRALLYKIKEFGIR